MKEYVLTFLFTPNLRSVWLIEKNKPEWQKGCLNGIGGKREICESINDAALRELREESGVRGDEIIAFQKVGLMHNDEFKVHFFTGICYKKLETMESEEIKEIDTYDILSYKIIDNIPLLIEACKHKLRAGLPVEEIIIKYDNQQN